MGKTEDLSGVIFGRLIAKEKAGTDKHNHTMWLCECACGKEIITTAWNLKSGMTKSCGCYRSKCSRQRTTARNQNTKPRIIHGDAMGQSPSRLYRVWQGMKTRCNNPNADGYKNYGGKGVKVCEEWKSYNAFKEWAVQSGYDELAAYGKCTIDRINPEGDYSPDNCRWVDMKTQQNNKRSTRKCLA